LTLNEPGTYDDGFGGERQHHSRFILWCPRPGGPHPHLPGVIREAREWSASWDITLDENAGDGRFGRATSAEVLDVFLSHPFGVQIREQFLEALNERWEA
jgi:hypothetical protein